MMSKDFPDDLIVNEAYGYFKKMSEILDAKGRGVFLFGLVEREDGEYEHFVNYRNNGKQKFNPLAIPYDLAVLLHENNKSNET